MLGKGLPAVQAKLHQWDLPEATAVAHRPKFDTVIKKPFCRVPQALTPSSQHNTHAALMPHTHGVHRWA